MDINVFRVKPYKTIPLVSPVRVYSRSVVCALGACVCVCVSAVVCVCVLGGVSMCAVRRESDPCTAVCV